MGEAGDCEWQGEFAASGIVNTSVMGNLPKSIGGQKVVAIALIRQAKRAAGDLVASLPKDCMGIAITEDRNGASISTIVMPRGNRFWLYHAEHWTRHLNSPASNPVSSSTFG